MNINLTDQQTRYVMQIVAIDDPKEAVQYFADIMQKERLDPAEMSTYVSRMMAKEKKNESN